MEGHLAYSAPNKICHFIWTAVKESLPTKENLHKRHIPLDMTCSLCDEHQETTLHALWLCDQAKAIWKSEVCFAALYKTHFRTFMDLFEAVLGKGSVFHVTWFSMTTWSLWQRRNRIREKQSSWPLHEVSMRAKNMVAEYLRSTSIHPRFKGELSQRVGNLHLKVCIKPTLMQPTLATRAWQVLESLFATVRGK